MEHRQRKEMAPEVTGVAISGATGYWCGAMEKRRCSISRFGEDEDNIDLGTEAYDSSRFSLTEAVSRIRLGSLRTETGVHPVGREQDEEKGQQREAPVADHVRPQVVAANANELVLDDVAGGEAVVEIGEGDVGLSLRILLSKGMSEVVTTTGKLFQFNTSANNPDIIKSSQTPPHASIRKQRRGAMEEEWRREEGLAVVDEKNIPDQQQQQHQWRMKISNTSDEDNGDNGALGSGDGGEARTNGDDEEQSKPRRPKVEPAMVVGHLVVGTETTGAMVQ
ncbi:hypothetical protein LR48_Vigan03g236900 [Vigna angularis]|uniref:Uncharacterized protein n=1 Tax=Phaseolus angularis TaxID=3914 RepID=A0A0L9U8L2_PHAAN|nr:hypothetical protein LR48_Vigan03g236900 [Vigna angularis]